MEGAWAELPWIRPAESCFDYERASPLLAFVVISRESDMLMTGEYLTLAYRSDELQVGLEVDVSILLPEGIRAFVMSPCELYETVSVWPVESIRGEASELLGSLTEVTDSGELAWRMEQWCWLRSFSSAKLVKGGIAFLTDDAVRILKVGEGDELLVVGCGNHIEIWNPEQWTEAERRLEETLVELMGEFHADGER